LRYILDPDLEEAERLSDEEKERQAVLDKKLAEERAARIRMLNISNQKAYEHAPKIHSALTRGGQTAVKDGYDSADSESDTSPEVRSDCKSDSDSGFEFPPEDGSDNKSETPPRVRSSNKSETPPRVRSSNKSETPPRVRSSNKSETHSVKPYRGPKVVKKQSKPILKKPTRTVIGYCSD
jgi:hypothetical protein